MDFSKFIQAINLKWVISRYIVRHPNFIKDDASFLKWTYYHAFQKFPNLTNPSTFNEKLQWMKLWYHRPEFVVLADKIEAKKWVANIIGNEYIISTLGIWDDSENINLKQLPKQFVLKCNHNSGTGLFICKDKNAITSQKWDKIKKDLNKGLAEDYYLQNREWPYKDIPRKILAEIFIIDNNHPELNDYKFFCFNGEPYTVLVATDRSTMVHFDFFDMSFKHMPFRQKYDVLSPHKIEKPKNFELMIDIARKLSKDIPHVRVDLYNIDGKIYFGEMTFFNNSGLEPFVPEVWDYKLGEMIILPEKTI